MFFGARKRREDLRGRWSDVGRVFFTVLICYMTLRWISWEPYVIPSGSMKPTLLVQDYVLVKKWAYGVRLPFTTSWLFGPSLPARGDIVVFKSLDDDAHFMVKRVVGLPGDQVKMSANGELSINGKSFERSLDTEKEDEDYLHFTEDNGNIQYTIQQADHSDRTDVDYTVPEGHLFMMGDNRDRSMDSRYWGSLPLERVLGQVSLIWMSCGESQEFSTFLCPPEAFRTERIMKVVR